MSRHLSLPRARGSEAGTFTHKKNICDWNRNNFGLYNEIYLIFLASLFRKTQIFVEISRTYNLPETNTVVYS